MILNIGTKLRKYSGLMQRARTYRSLPAQFWDLILFKLKLGIHPFDYYELELFKVDGSWEEKRRYVGQNGSSYWPYANNPLRYNLLFIDKYVEKAVLKGLDIPTPKLLAAIGDCYEIRSLEDLEAFFTDQRGDVVIKPVSGMGGRDVLVLRKTDQGYLSGDRMYSIDDIWNHRKTVSGGKLIIEERVIGAGLAQQMHPASLNTFRVCTIRTNDMEWHTAPTILKLGRGGAAVDNVGSTGIVVYLDAQGKTTDAFDFLNGCRISHHPDTGILLLGVEVEGYKEVIAAALCASRKLGFMGSIGWDIAYSERGPLILEGNLWWSCKIHQLRLGPLITDELAEGLSIHKPFGKWDRRNMYPGFIEDIRKRTQRNKRSS